MIHRSQKMAHTSPQMAKWNPKMVHSWLNEVHRWLTELHKNNKISQRGQIIVYRFHKLVHKYTLRAHRHLQAGNKVSSSNREQMFHRLQNSAEVPKSPMTMRSPPDTRWSFTISLNVEQIENLDKSSQKMILNSTQKVQPAHNSKVAPRDQDIPRLWIETQS